MRSALCQAVLSVSLLFASSLWGDDREPARDQATTDQRSQRAEALVQQLSAPSFVQRELAMAELLELGAPALPAVETAAASNDREVRSRAQHILRLLKHLGRQRVIDAFVAGHAVDADQLPGWPALNAIVGGSPGSRSLYIKMLETEQPLLEAAIDQPAGQVQPLLDARVRHLQAGLRHSSQQLDVGTIATLLFVALQEDVLVTDATLTTIYSFCYRPEFLHGINSTTLGPVLRQLLSHSYQSNNLRAAMPQRLYLALRFDLPSGLPLARDVLRNPVRLNPYLRQNAILLIGKLGEDADLSLIEPLLDDAGVCSTQTVDGVRRSTQVRDVALAVLAHRASRDLKALGFAQVRRDRAMLFIPSSLSFRTDKDRQQARQKWTQFQDGLTSQDDPAQAQPQ